MQTHSGWMVRAGGAVYSPYSCSETALAEAVDEAQAAGIFGFASVVLLRPAIGQPYDVRWLYGHNPYPPDLMRMARGRGLSKRERLPLVPNCKERSKW
jgi:hypothetical protein